MSIVLNYSAGNALLTLSSDCIGQTFSFTIGWTGASSATPCGTPNVSAINGSLGGVQYAPGNGIPNINNFMVTGFLYADTSVPPTLQVNGGSVVLPYGAGQIKFEQCPTPV